MGLRSNKRLIAFKNESSYGVDPTLAGSNALLVRNLDFNPLDAELAQRDLIRGFFGNSDTLVAAAKVSLGFEIELAGSGIVGVAPAWGGLLKACAMAESISTITISSLTRSGGTATATTASPHGLAVGEIVKVSGATETEYNKNATVLTVADSTHFTYAVTGTPTSPATGTPVINTGAVYTPVSSALGSGAFLFNVDGVQHPVFGARGTFEIVINARGIPVLRFNFTGLYTAPTDVAALTPDYSGFVQPQVANSEHTTGFSFLGHSGVLSSLSFNVSNEVFYRNLIGTESVEIVDRKPAGSIMLEAPLMASKDFFTVANDGTTGALAITHGSVGGNKVVIAAPRVSIGNPSYQDDNGTQMLSIPFVATPNTGNDDFTITVK